MHIFNISLEVGTHEFIFHIVYTKTLNKMTAFMMVKVQSSSGLENARILNFPKKQRVPVVRIY